MEQETVLKLHSLLQLGGQKKKRKRKWDRGAEKKKTKDQREKLIMGDKHMTPFFWLSSCTVNAGLLWDE